MAMNKCTFYVAWFAGSEGADGEDTGVNSQDDLVSQYNAGNEHVRRFEYEAPEGFEWEVGAAKAFRQNYTAHDSVSIVFTNEEL